jgi:tellurite resistance protein
MKNTIEKLRGTKISDDEYKIFILTYPLFLIAIADGTFDPEEKDFMKNILYNFLNPLYNDNITHEQYESLINNYILDFEELFRSNNHKVEILTEFSKFDKEVKNAILELLNEVASISDGISEQEKLEISNVQDYI